MASIKGRVTEGKVGVRGGMTIYLGLLKTPSYSSTTYPWLQLPAVNHGLQADALLPNALSVGQ